MEVVGAGQGPVGQPRAARLGALAFQVTVTEVTWVLRSTRSWAGIARPHCTVVQIRSVPEVILSASVLPDSFQLQAG